MSTIRRFVPFAKVEKQDDGTLLVEGVASSETRDSDGEIITADAMRKAIPGFLRADGTGPVREMHALKAAGKTVEVWVDKEKRTRVSAIVVDSEAAKKVETGVYQGFSVGGKALSRSVDDPSVITELKWVELSLVDRGANPDAVISLWKADAMPEKNTEPRPFVKLAALVDKFKKGDVQLDDAEKRAVDIVKVLAPPPAPTSIRKGMYQVARAAELMDGLAALQDSCKYEAEYEGDASKVPAMFSDCMRSFAAAMKALLDEELSEALGGEDAEKVASAADRAGSLSKAAGEAAKKLAEIMKAQKTAPPAAAPPTKGEEKTMTTPAAAPAAQQTDVEKAIAKAKEELETKLAKAQAEREQSAAAQSASHQALAKALELGEQMKKQQAEDEAQSKLIGDAIAELNKKYDAEIAKVAAETEELRKIAATAASEAQKTNALNEKLVEELAKRPKGALKAVPISKAQDNGTAPEPKATDSKDPVELLKAVHANGPSIDLTARLRTGGRD